MAALHSWTLSSWVVPAITVPAGLKAALTMFASWLTPLTSSRPLMGTAWEVSSVLRT